MSRAVPAYDGGNPVIPFPLKWQLPRPPVNEDDRLYMQAFQCLSAAAWRFAAARSRLLDAPGSGSFSSALSDYEFARQVGDELIEGAIAYMQLRAQLREPAPTA